LSVDLPRKEGLLGKYVNIIHRTALCESSGRCPSTAEPWIVCDIVVRLAYPNYDDNLPLIRTGGSRVNEPVDGLTDAYSLDDDPAVSITIC